MLLSSDPEWRFLCQIGYIQNVTLNAALFEIRGKL